MVVPRIIPSLRRWFTLRSLAATLVCVSACGGGAPTVPSGPPALTVQCPAAIQKNSLGGASLAVDYPTPVTAGGTAPVQITCSPASGSVFPSGTSNVTCTGVDAAGRSATCSFAVSVVTLPQLSKTRFMAFGDSLTEGKLSVTAALLVESPEHSYPAKLLQLLKDRYTEQQLTMINEGFGGEKATDSVGRFRSALSVHRPEVVLILHGVNDLNGTGDDRVQLTVDAIEELVQQARGEGLAALVATLPPLGPPKGGCPECVPPLNDRIRRLAQDYGVTLVDIFEAFSGRTDLMGPDGIHPSASGYEVIATTFFEAIKRTLEVTPSSQ